MGAPAPERSLITTSSKSLARIAGLLYLIVAVFGGFAYGFVIGTVYAPGNAAVTTANVLANPSLVRMGIVADLFQATVFVFLAMVIYVLLKDVSKFAARAVVILVAIAASIMCINEVFLIAALLVATNASYATALGATVSSSFVLLLFDMQHYGFLIAQIFFGLWLVPFGYLAYVSGRFPKALGILLVVGGICYLVDTIALLLIPDLGTQVAMFLVIPPTIAEIWMVAYLLIWGMRTSPPAAAAHADPAGTS